ncbi:MAG: PEGA domain-containing protein, partial [Candidatus Caldatribacteriota bacterium]|nr:PEGA domain-containing protein [Candidatus Caldatribacteriota bacterium]
MLKNISLVKRQKISTCIFIILVLFLCLSVFGVSFAQSPTSKEVEKMKSIQIINPHPAFSLRLWLDRPRNDNLAPGEKITIYFQSTRDAFVTLYNYDTAGRVKIIFPNKYSPHNLIKSGQKYKVEGQIAPDTQPGTEFVQGFATTRPLLVNENIRNLISKKFMPEVSNDYRAYNSRIKSIIVSSPPATWVSSNLLSFRIVPVTPPTVHYGRIVVSSNPSGAKVYLDNSYRGTTPINLDRVNTGKHSIKLVKSGYQEWNKSVYVYSSRTTQVFADLLPLPQFGSISVYCNQGNAKIYLDGKYKRRTSANRSVELKNIE